MFEVRIGKVTPKIDQYLNMTPGDVREEMLQELREIEKKIPVLKNRASVLRNRLKETN